MKINHVALILDGNRRFAKRLLLEPQKGHEYGAGKVEKLLEWAKELKIPEITLYAFSMENFNRPKKEFNYLMKLFKKEFQAMLNDGRLERESIKINFIGEIQQFPKGVFDMMNKLMEKTKNNNSLLVNFAMAYGGKTEIVNATKKIAELVKKGKLSLNEIDEEKFKEFLYLKNEPEIIIRTSGERRTSNFLPYQSAYSEWFFLDKFWPEFEKEDLINCIQEFKKRKRNFGR